MSTLLTSFPDFVFMQELPAHHDQIEKLNAEAFGPGRFSRAAHLIREGGGHDPRLSYVALLDDEVIGTIRMTEIVIGDVAAWMLGPIVIRPDYKSAGLGGRLMRIAIEATEESGAKLIILVGDAPYYERFGFRKIPYGAMTMPATVNPARFLALEFEKGTMEKARGPVRHRARTLR